MKYKDKVSFGGMLKRKNNIRSLTLEELKEFFVQQGDKAFVANKYMSGYGKNRLVDLTK